ncbi:MAG: hypothetical protein CMG47_01895 [Candidatus Marinimicrobia bacterium]|jgi:hypothetical protein|nr:hypothetical protein [Candidatus Neomarinimicrobiota bacterium]
MNDNNKSLNDILNEYQLLENELISTNGEINEDLESKLNLHEKELGEKLDGYEHFVRYLKGKVEYLKSMENHYSKRRKVLENSIKRCKNSMTSSLVITGKNKIQTSDFNFSLGKSQKWSINIEIMNEDDKVELIDKNLAENTFQVKLSDIKTEFSNIDSEDIPEWINIEETDFIKVR